MRAQCALVTCLILLACSSATAWTVTVGPDDPMDLIMAWYTSSSVCTVRMLPGTYVVGEPAIHWPLPLTENSPCLVGDGGPDGVIIQGTGVEQAFFLDENVWDAHIHFEHITFLGLHEIIGRVSTSTGGAGVVCFADNIVEGCGGGASYPALRVTGCSGIIARNEFRDNLGYCVGTYHTSAAIEDNEMYGSLGGIRDQCCESPAVRRNHVHDNSEIGIDTGYYQGGPIEYNIVERNGTGLTLGSYFDVEYNIVRENTRGVACGGIAVGNAAVHHNDIYDNVEYDLMSASEGPLNHDCTMNWWGSTDPLVIAAGIRDCNDDPDLNVTVVFEPFCVAPGCGSTPVQSRTWGAIKAMYRR